jgi:hypothetical protein
MTDSNPIQHLRTKCVFIDTEASRKARFDWTGRPLSKLVEFAKQDHLQILITEVTIGEVKSQLGEVLAEVAVSMKKHERLCRPFQTSRRGEVHCFVGDRPGRTAATARFR